MTLDIPEKELDTLQNWVAEKIQAVFDDPWSCCDNESELVCHLAHLRNICTSLKLDYLVVARREASSYELRQMKKILPTCDLIPVVDMNDDRNR